MSNDHKSNGIKKDPFVSGVWIIIVLGGCDIIAMIEENKSQSELKQELFSNKCILATLKRRYILKQLQFPMPEMDARGKHTGGWQTGAIATVGKHEISLELMNEFPVYACLTNISFISEFSPDDIERLRQTVINADNAAEMTIRATKANILLPNQNISKG
jgi:hypothetical protein